MQHTATYYDGQTSKPHDARIEVFGNSLSVFYEENKVVWTISEIEYSSFSGKGKSMLQYDTFPHQYLEFPADSPLAQVLGTYLPQRKGKFGALPGAYNAIVKGALITLAIVSVAIAGLYFILLPKLASYIAENIPISTEIAMGDKLYESFIGTSKIDSVATRTLNEFAQKIDFKTKYPLKFTVVASKEVNAFALPGGNVVVFSGILDKVKSSEELAALLSHEVTHINERHSLKGLTRNLTGSVLISLVFGDSGSLGTILVNKADDVYQLGFSRSMEKEADLEGLKIMNYNRIDSQGMLRLMQRLQEEEKKQQVSKMSSYLNSHPMTEERISYIKENSQEKNGVRNEALEEIWNRIKNADY